MEYFKLLEEGNTLKFTYNKYQSDGFDHKWTTETWKKINDSQYTCEYNDCVELDKSTFDRKDAEIFMKENEKFESRNEMSVEIVDSGLNGGEKLNTGKAKLSDYESTGFTPEQINKMYDNLKVSADLISRLIIGDYKSIEEAVDDAISWLDGFMSYKREEMH